MPWLAVVLLLLPLVVAAVVLVLGVGADYHPYADHALTELRTRDALHHSVLVGLYSREGWSHPGPALFYLSAVPYWLTGSSSIGIALAALAVNGVAVAGMAWLAWRRGGRALLLLTCLGCAVLMRALGADFLRDPWVPYVPVLSFGLLLFLLWTLVEGELWALPVAAIVGSFVVQTHVGYAALVLPLVSLAIAWSFVSAWRGRVGTERRELASRAVWVLAITTGIVALLWTPPLVEEARHSPGNLASIVDYFRRGGDLHSLTDGFRVLAAQFTVTPDWVTGATHASPFTGETGLLTSSPLPVLVVPLAAAAGLLRAWRCGPALRLLVLVVVAVILGVLAVARTIGYVFAYRLGWSWVLGMVAAIVVGWAVWLLFERRTAVGTGRVRTVVLLALGAITAVNVATAAEAGIPQQPESSRLGHLVRSVVDALPESDGEVLVKSEGFPANWYGWGLLLGLERRGVAAQYTGQERIDLAGSHRVHRGGPVRAVLTIASDEQVDALARRRDVRLVAYTGDLSPRRRADEVRRLSALDRQHEDGTIDDVEYFTERGELVRRLGTAVGVFSQVRR